MTNKLSDRLRYFMKCRGNLSEIDLARAASLPQPTVHHILSGATTRPHRKSLIALANALSISISDLLDETPVEELHTRFVTHQLTSVPLLTWEQAIGWPQLKHQNPYFAASQNIFTDAKVSQSAFALRVKGSAMETLFPEGTLLVVDPEQVIRDKSFVVVHLENEAEALFKQILLDGAHCYLQSLNPYLNKLEPVPLNETDRIIGVVVQTRINLIE